MAETISKKAYVWQLARFLTSLDKKMSGRELSEHLNRNNIETDYGTEYRTGRGVFTLIRETYKWLNEELGLPNEAATIAIAFVNQKGLPAYSNKDEG